MNHTLRLAAFCLLATSAAAFAAPDVAAADWTLGPFARPAGVNPVIAPRRDTLFDCPMRGRPVRWEALHTFNPAAVVRDGRVYLLYRAEDDTGEGIGGHTSRLGLAESDDGLRFRRLPRPVFYPDADAQKANEWDGGCEDPRIVEAEDGRYVMTYTQWNRTVPRLAIATSRDLRRWRKHGPAFSKHGAAHVDRPHKSGAIVSRLDGGRLKAARIRGRYWMYWGEGGVGAAWSTDLVNWTPVERAPGERAVMLDPRPGRFDSELAEGGPPPVLTPRGIVMLYNGKNSPTAGDRTLSPGAYAGGQALFDANDPTRLLARTDEPFFRPELPFERTGQYPAGTTFLEALAYFRGRWFLYYGCADSLVAVAVAPGAESAGAARSAETPFAWTFASDRVQLTVTRDGAHTAPVVFDRNSARPIRPYYVSPWQGEGRTFPAVPVLGPLRGDFFCLPFGGNGKAYRGEQHPPHGETAGSPWTLVRRTDRGAVHALTLALEPRARAGRVTQTLSLVDGEDVLYKRTTIEGFAGPTSLGHHAILALPAGDRSLLIGTRPFALGMTAPFLFSDPAKAEYQSLAIGARFTDLARVPSRFRDQPDQDCSSFPIRRGFADLVQTFNHPDAGAPDWLTAVNVADGWLFYTLKDPAVLPARVYWMEDHGRHAAPWNGRNACLGIEDTCSFFDAGVAESASPNAITALGFPTSHALTGAPFHVNYIQGAVRIPPGFGRVTSAHFTRDSATFTDAAGRRVRARVNTEFLRTGRVR